MVMTTDSTNEEQPEQAVLSTVLDLGDADAPEDQEQSEELQEAPLVEAGPTEVVPGIPDDTGAPVLDEDGTPPLDAPQQMFPGNQEQELMELQRHRQANAQKEWQQNLIREAQAVERRAQEQGADPQSARLVARQHLAHAQKLRQQDEKALDLVGFVEGRNNAAMNYAQKYNLLPKQALADIQALTRTRTPQEMDVEAKRIAQFRSQRAEIERLKQGRVAPQTFDNSQGSAEVTTNQDRLLDAYINGDRSEAATNAARRLHYGG